MNIFQKMGLVEEVAPAIDVEADYEVSEEYEIEEIDANLEGVTRENLVADIYSANNLNDFSHSIFKVGELINSLPKEMVTETKKASVLAILSSFGLTATEVVEDGTTRISLLNAALSEIVETNTAKMEECMLSIEEHKKAIAELEKTISDATLDNKACRENIELEVSKITELINFAKEK